MTKQGGFGLEVKITVSAALTAIAYLKSDAMPEFEKVMADVTGHDAVGGYEVWIPTGKRKMSEFVALLTWDASAPTHVAIQAAFDADTSVGMSVVAPDGSESITFQAFISKMGRVSAQDDSYSCSVSIRPTGAPTLTVTPSVPDALTLVSSTPIDNAISVSKTANQTLTFSNALTESAPTGVVLLDASLVPVAGAITIDAARKVITINPTATLTGSAAYSLVYSVVDIYAQPLVGVVTFTTAA